MSGSRVFTIAPGAPFLPTLVEALLSGTLVGPIGDDPFALGGVTIYLPTRRAARALSSVLSERLGRAALLPRMIPLGEADEAEFDLAVSPLLEGAEALLHPPIAPLQRRLILARLVQSWARNVDRSLLPPMGDDVPFRVPSSPSDAVGLAANLERLMDALTVEGLPWDEIGAAVEAEYSRYFGLTLDFLRIAAEAWPVILAERGLSDPVARAKTLVLAAAERLVREPISDPVIVAGSTGSFPATAKLITAVSGLPRGAVVLPGLDLDLDTDAWDAIEREGEPVAHGHPQAILHRLVGKRFLGVGREDVVPLGAPDASAVTRSQMLSQSLRPAETTDTWASMPVAEREALARAGMTGVAIVEAADEREEALVAALALRETLETPGATAALITPDRNLALRVSAELARWGIVAEDSAGTSLARAPAGRFARLVAELATEVAPARVIALLAHPFVRLGLTRSEVVRAAAALEIGALRGLAPKAGFVGMLAALQARHVEGDRRVPRAKLRLKDVDWQLAGKVLTALDAAFRNFTCAAEDGSCDLVALAGFHRVTCDALLDCPAGEPGPEDDASLDALDTLFDDLESAGAEKLPGRFSDYPAFFTMLARERVVSVSARAAHPRLRILGLLEARLLSTDRVVLGGLDEGVWPLRTQTDAFLNRPMRERVGLGAPERRIGQTAHDFVQALGCRDAIVTRAAKREGAPTVPSRFLQRLRAFTGTVVWSEAVARGGVYRGHAAALDAGRETAPPRLTQPKPKPDPALFPDRLSVTEIETLVRDPYAIFARRILGLERLDPVATIPGPAERGTMVHEVLGKFAEAYPAQIADWSLAKRHLDRLAEDGFARLKRDHPDLYEALHAEWRPRNERTAEAFLAWEAARRPEILRVHAEIKGRMPLELGTRTITLTGVADRIEQHGDGYRIIDFKTGTPPTNKVVFAGFSPQLTLEAAMLRAGAFPELKSAAVADLLYVHASGGRDPFRQIDIKPPKEDARTVEELVDEHLARLHGLLARFLAGEAAFVSRPYPQYASRYGAYDHLARVLEWSLAGEGEAA